MMPISTLRRFAPLVLLGAAFSGGCAALTNPVAEGVPVRRVPVEVLGRPKSELQPVPLTLLRRKKPDEYKLDKGDVIAVIAGDLFGPENIQPPLKLADSYGTEAAVGFPVPVRDDGTISLPSAKLKPIDVRGKTVTQVEKDLVAALLPIFKEGQNKISVQLHTRRRVKVQVVREDTVPAGQSSGGTFLAGSKKGNGYIVPLEFGENDVLHALDLTGGLLGIDAKNEIVIQRGQYDPQNPAKGITRVPLRIYPDQPLSLSEADVTLNEGDILYIASRDSEVYYTAGVLGSRQVPLPRDYDLDVLQAIAQNGGPLINGGFTQNAFIAQSFASGLGTPSPSLCTVVRKLPNGQQIPIRVDITRAMKDPRERILIMPDDILVMQEKPGEAVLRYMTQQFRFNTTAETIRSENIMQTFTGSIP